MWSEHRGGYPNFLGTALIDGSMSAHLTSLLHAFRLTYRRGSIRQAATELYITPQP